MAALECLLSAESGHSATSGKCARFGLESGRSSFCSAMTHRYPERKVRINLTKLLSNNHGVSGCCGLAVSGGMR